MRIAVVGAGYVGLVSGVCFAGFGIEVVCVDKNQDKINLLKSGEIPIYEPGLKSSLERQIQAERIRFTDCIAEGVRDADVVFIAVGTPPSPEDGQADLSYVYQASREIAEHIENFTVIVTKSTVPVGTSREIETIIRDVRPDADFAVASNPEFLREGSAINDFMKPDRIVIGTDDDRADDLLREVYKPLSQNGVPIIVTKRETAEIIKYASNAFLATKITFINEIANLCEKTGANVQEVARGIGLDGRIGSKFLHAGPGYGGSCFPKDTLALTQIGQKYGAPQNIVETVIWVNAERQRSMADRIRDICGGDVNGMRVGILGVSFKPNTDDVREAPSLAIVPLLQEDGAHIAAYDPAAMEEAAHILEDVEWCKDPYEVATNADVLVILTEWNEFRALDLKRIAGIMKQKRLVDLRNIYKPTETKEHGFEYVSVGRL